MPTPLTVHPVELPFDITNRISGGPIFADTTTEDANLSRQTNLDSDEAIWEWSLNFTRELPLIRECYSFWLSRRGRAYGWLLDDPTDNEDEGAGVVKLFPDDEYYLCKRYDDDFLPYFRIIRYPRPDSLVFSGVSGTPEIELGTGRVVGATSEGTAIFTFVTAVTFVSNVLSIMREASHGEWLDVGVREVHDYVVAEAE